MFRFSLFKKPNHQEFIYIPRYWEPEKEELQERIRAAKGDQEHSIDHMKSRIGQTYQSRKKAHRQSARKTIRTSNMRLLIIFIVLAFFSYLLLLRFLPLLEKMLE